MRHSGLAIVFALSTVLAMPASALQKFEQYRIMGSEISAVRIGPQEVEDPATLIIDLVSDTSEPKQIMLESDGGLDAASLPSNMPSVTTPAISRSHSISPPIR
jgi:hypothetical protein